MENTQNYKQETFMKFMKGIAITSDSWEFTTTHLDILQESPGPDVDPSFDSVFYDYW